MNSTPWDQFETNERLFGAKTDYDEELYTTKLDRSTTNYKRREREAERMAQEIMSVSRGLGDHSDDRKPPATPMLQRSATRQRPVIPRTRRKSTLVSRATPMPTSPLERASLVPSRQRRRTMQPQPLRRRATVLLLLRLPRLPLLRHSLPPLPLLATLHRLFQDLPSVHLPILLLTLLLPLLLLDQDLLLQWRGAPALYRKARLMDLCP